MNWSTADGNLGKEKVKMTWFGISKWELKQNLVCLSWLHLVLFSVKFNARLCSWIATPKLWSLEALCIYMPAPIWMIILPL